MNGSRKRVLLLLILPALVTLYKWITKQKRNKRRNNNKWDYNSMKLFIKNNDIKIPAMIIDIDIFRENVKILASHAKKYNKTLRMATKSIRVPYLIDYALTVSDVLKGFMCFSVFEASKLYEYGQTTKNKDKYNDFLIAYPTIQKHDIYEAYNLAQKGVIISLMVDCVEHLNIIEEYCHKCNDNTNKFNQVGICIDLDMSYRISNIIRLGAHRSCIHNCNDLKPILNKLKTCKYIALNGVMGYEASVAGVTDNNPYNSIPNFIVQLLKPIFQRDCNNRRKNMVNFIKSYNIPTCNGTFFINGGGTGNIHICSQDNIITEVTAGSGMIQSKIFDYFVNSQCQCAGIFGLQITRISNNEKYIVCQSGGFIGSGEISKDKEPVCYLPNNIIIDCYKSEGFGEVQTPLKVNNVNIFKHGDPVFFRSAKAGEISERFNTYIIKSGNKYIKNVKTYRGFGWNFF